MKVNVSKKIAASAVIATVFYLLSCLPTAGRIISRIIPQSQSASHFVVGLDGRCEGPNGPVPCPAIPRITVGDKVLEVPAVAGQQVTTTNNVLVASQLAVGGGYVSGLSVQNPDGGTLFWSANFYDPQGFSLGVNIRFYDGWVPPNQPVKGVFGQMSGVGSGGSFDLSLDQAGVQTGYIRMTYAGPTPIISLRYSLFDGQASLREALAVNVAAPAAMWTVPVKQSSTEDPGVAIANPGVSAVEVKFDLYTNWAPGAPYATASILLPPGGQVAMFLNQLQWQLAVGGTGPVMVASGLVKIYTSDGSVVGVTAVQEIYSSGQALYLMAGVPVTAGTQK